MDHVERTLLSAALDLGFDVDLGFGGWHGLRKFNPEGAASEIKSLSNTPLYSRRESPYTADRTSLWVLTLLPAIRFV